MDIKSVRKGQVVRFAPHSDAFARGMQWGTVLTVGRSRIMVEWSLNPTVVVMARASDLWEAE